LFAKLWKVAGLIFAGLFIAGMCCAGLSAEASNAISNILTLAVSVFIGYQGNSWVESSLISRGYLLKDNVIAANKDAAIAEAMRA
jgi:uncharacterized protein YacL